jgi:hypothetical protein
VIETIHQIEKASFSPDFKRVKILRAVNVKQKNPTLRPYPTNDHSPQSEESKVSPINKPVDKKQQSPKILRSKSASKKKGLKHFNSMKHDFVRDFTNKYSENATVTHDYFLFLIESYKQLLDQDYLKNQRELTIDG